MHINDGHGTGIVRYSAGKHKGDNNPEQREAANFDEFQDAILAMVSKAKGQKFICSPMSLGTHDKPEEYAGDGHWRLKNRCMSRRYIPFDFDGFESPEVAEQVLGFFARYRGFGYYTSSSTPENPRARVILELSEEVDRREGILICKTLQAIVLKKFGAESVAFDESVYRGEQPVYTPVGDVDSFEFRGKPVDVTAFRKVVPAEVVKPERKEFPLFQVERLGVERVYPPSSGIEVANQCNQIAYMRDTRGAVEEPVWRLGIGILKHTVEGEALCHEWSKGDPRYDYDQTQDKIDRWETPPTLCSSFQGERACASRCDSCQFKGKVTTPLQLGYIAKVEAPELSQPVEVAASTINYKDHWPDGFRWDESTNTLQRRVLNRDDVPEWIPFCDALFYPVTRIQQEDGTWSMRCRMQVSKGRWREFDVPTKQLASVDTLCGTLASFEVITKYKQGHHAMAFMSDWVARYKEKAIEINMFKNYGWHRDFTSFLIGDNLINGDGSESKVIMGAKVPREGELQLVGYGTAGTAENWIQILNQVYDRPGAEDYQFTILALLSSPMTGLLDINGWNGISVAWTGENGQGKTAMGMAACSAYGRPSAFVLPAENATINSFDPFVGTMKHLPVVLDELTGRDPKPLLGRLYALTNGGGRVRADKEGNFSSVLYTWKLISLITGNSNINESMSELKRQVADAGSVRVFEFQITDPDYMKKIFGDEDCQALLEKLNHNYGCVGRIILPEMMKRIDQLRSDFLKARAELGYESDEYDPQERFFVALVAQTAVFAHMLVELGIIKWDINKSIARGIQQIKAMRAMRKEYVLSTSDTLAGLLTSLMGKLIVTKDMRKEYPELPMDIAPLRGQSVVARMCIGKGTERLIVSSRYFTQWCADHNVQASVFKRYLTEEKYIRPGPHKATITVGTGIPSAQENVLEFDYFKVMNVDAEPIKELGSKVVNLR